MRRIILLSAVGLVTISLAPFGHAQQAATGRACVRPAARPVTAGEVVTLRDADSRGCTLAFPPTGVRLLPANDGSRPDPGLRLVMDGTGRFYTANARGYPGTIAVWGPDGAFLRTIGREGQGPGELSARGAVSMFVDAKDNLHVRDGSPGWSTFDPAGKFVKRVSSQELGGFAGTTAVLDDGTVLTGATVPSGAGYYFHLADLSGKPIRSFGPVSSGAGERNPREERSVAYAGGTEFWATPAEGDPRGYVLERWSTDGKLLQTIRRDVPWFRVSGGASRNREDPPQPQVSALHLDDSGLLIAIATAPNAKWRYIADLAERRRVGDEFIDVWIDAIDTRSAALLSSERFTVAQARQHFRDFVPRRGLVYHVGETADGLPLIELRRIELRAR